LRLKSSAIALRKVKAGKGILGLEFNEKPMKRFSILPACLLVAIALPVFPSGQAHANGCFMVDPSGRKIEMDFCGVNSSDVPVRSNARSTAPVSEQQSEVDEVSANFEGETVTRAKWQELKTFVAQLPEKTRAKLSDVQGIMGFEGNLVKTQPDGSQQWEWVDSANPRIKVVGIFTSGELTTLKGTVY
jgi:hypothetical protein